MSDSAVPFKIKQLRHGVTSSLPGDNVWHLDRSCVPFVLFEHGSGTPAKLHSFASVVALLDHYKSSNNGLQEAGQIPSTNGTFPSQANSSRLRSETVTTTTSNSLATSFSLQHLHWSCWLDVQTSDEKLVREVLRVFDMDFAFSLSSSTIYDTFEFLTTHGFLFANLVLVQRKVRKKRSCQSGAPKTGYLFSPSSTQAASGEYTFLRSTWNDSANFNDIEETAPNSLGLSLECEDELQDGTVVVSVYILPDAIITVHSEPFRGFEETVQELANSTLKWFDRKNKRAALNVKATERDSLIANVPQCACDDKQSISSFSQMPLRLATPQLVLASLLRHSCRAFYPNLIRLRAYVEHNARMVSGITAGYSDQREMFKATALIRKDIIQCRGRITQKEGLLQQLLSPSARVTFISRESMVANQYRILKQENSKIGKAIDECRESVGNTNIVFLNGIQIQLTDREKRMNLFMKILHVVTLIALPIEALATLWGANVLVPYPTETNSTVVCFFIIVLIAIFWASFWMPILVKQFKGLSREARAARKAGIPALL